MKVLALLIICVSVQATAANAQTTVFGSNNGKYVKISGTDIYYEEYGKGLPVLLLEGGGGSIKDFRKIIPDLSKRFRVIAVDSPDKDVHKKRTPSATRCSQITSQVSSII